MDRGYVRLYRKLLDSGLLKNPVLFTFKSWCLLRASWKGHRVWINGEEVELGPGEFVFGRQAACTSLGLSEKQVRNAVESSVKSRFIEATRRASKYTVYRVVNWDTYQSDADEKGQQEGQQKGQVRASTRAASGPAEGQHRGHIQEGKEGKKGKQEEPTSCPEALAGSALEPVVIELPTNRKGEEFGVTLKMAEEFEVAYPAVEVRAELGKMRAWLFSNPSQRKTSQGMLRFVNNWLARAQDRGPVPVARGSPSKPVTGVAAAKSLLEKMESYDEERAGTFDLGTSRRALPGVAGD